jgi:CRAL/TRIO domain
MLSLSSSYPLYRADELKTTDVAKEAATGKAYLHTTLDIQNRPVIIVRAAKHVNGAAPLLESQKLCVHTLDRAMERLPETGQETILGIFDLRGFTSKNADLGFIRFMVDVFFTFYPKRLSQVLFVDAPWIFMASWNVFKTWLSKYQALVRFVSAEQVRKEYFTAETVPEDFADQGFPRKK